jgi:hypothetical protein
VNRSQEEFDSISRAIKKELERFELERVRDFKSAFIAYLEAQMKAQDKVSFVVFLFTLVSSSSIRWREWKMVVRLAKTKSV